jgi:hypothetical protein
LPAPLEDGQGLALRDAATKKPVPVQVTRQGGKRVAHWIIDGLEAGKTQEFEATATAGEDAHGPGVALHDDGGAVAVDIKGKRFTAYHYAHRWARPFLYPLIGPGAARMTRGWPVEEDLPGETNDHPHHKSLWVAYGECGKTDNWSEEPGHGCQRHQSFLAKSGGPVMGQLTARNFWTTGAGRKQFEETRDMRFYALPRGVRLADLSITFKMTEGDVTFHDTKEGGLLSVRVASSMDVPRGGRIENAYGGVDEEETWGKKAPWCDYSGETDGTHAGVAIFDHEDNPRDPTAWHVRNYGLMTANCFGWRHFRPEAKVKGDMTFKKGSKTTWKYRLYIHRGDARRGRVAERFIDFIAPPRVTVEA